MFALPRSSWDDYDRALISEGGGVYSREQKSIPISPQVRTALGLADDVEEMTPPALMKAILQAPVDLFWNGGIGTYVKAETESDADVGDRANDAVRVNGNQLRAKVIGEGGNLGVTQRGRIEFELERRARQHRRAGQLGRRRLLRPRGEHQDPGRLPGHRRAGQRRGAHRRC